jgi:hypothetical protein
MDECSTERLGPIDLKVTAENIHDVSIGLALVGMPDGENTIADKGYDAEYICDAIVEKGSEPRIPRKSKILSQTHTLIRNFINIAILLKIFSRN